MGLSGPRLSRGTPGRKVEALGDYDKALAISGRLHNDEATMSIVQGVADTIGLDDAIKRLEDQAKGGDNRWRILMIDLYLRRHEYEKAEARADAILADADGGKLKSEERSAAYGMAGMAYMTAGHYPKAQATYEKLLQSMPDDTVALNNLACINMDFINPPNPAKALTYSQHALEVMQKQGISPPDLLDTHGWILANTPGRLDEGIALIQQSIEHRPLLDAHYHLGVALLMKNLAPEAVVELGKAQKMLDERKHKGQSFDPKMEANIAEATSKALAKAKAGSASSGTQPSARP